MADAKPERTLFSVILCTFNRAHLLPRALDSLIAQQEYDWEAVIIDDGSTDNTSEVVRSYVQKHTNILYRHQPNQGLPRSRNIAAGIATGEFITFLDSDDAFEPQHLAVRRAALEDHPDIDFFFGGTRIIGDPYVADKDNPERLIHVDECIVDATFVIRRKVFLELGGFPLLPYAAGNALYQIARRKGIQIMKIEAPTYIYDRTTPDSICTLASVGGVESINTFRPSRIPRNSTDTANGI